MWDRSYPRIAFSRRWDCSFYLFFESADDLNRFAESEADRFKADSCEIIGRFDSDGFCGADCPDYVLDLSENFERHYFNSDAMDGVRRI